ncbi:MAG: hypothetical protein M1118_11030, partial [Chloroflexi bacterium]|nr:hypothetical protein [Chloroflexota bacterium]
LMSFLIAQLGGSGWPKWPAPGQPLSWYAAPATGWSVNGGADGLPVQPVATETVTLQQVVDYVRSVWPGTLNGVAFPALGSTVTVPTSTGGSMSVTVTLDGTGVQHAAASLVLEF